MKAEIRQQHSRERRLEEARGTRRTRRAHATATNSAGRAAADPNHRGASRMASPPSKNPCARCEW